MFSDGVLIVFRDESAAELDQKIATWASMLIGAVQQASLPLLDQVPHFGPEPAGHP